MTRWIVLVSLCLSACVLSPDEPAPDPAEEDTAEAAQELYVPRKCSVWRDRQLIFSDGLYYPHECCSQSYQQCLPCDLYSCTFP